MEISAVVVAADMHVHVLASTKLGESINPPSEQDGLDGIIKNDKTPINERHPLPVDYSHSSNRSTDLPKSVQRLSMSSLLPRVIH
jgi:hypothetical protein